MLLQFTLTSGVLILVGADYNVPGPIATTTLAPTISVTPAPIYTTTPWVTVTTTPYGTVATTPYATSSSRYGKLYNAEAGNAQKKSTASHAIISPVWAYPLCASLAAFSCLTIVRSIRKRER